MNITTFADSHRVSFTVYSPHTPPGGGVSPLNFDSYWLILNFRLGLNVCRFDSSVEREPIENGL